MQLNFVVGVCILDVNCYKDFSFRSKQCTLPEERIEMIKKVAQKKGIYEILANALGNASHPRPLYPYVSLLFFKHLNIL